MIHEVMDYIWRHMNLCLAYTIKMQLVTYRNIYRYGCIYELVYTHIFPFSAS